MIYAECDQINKFTSLSSNSSSSKPSLITNTKPNSTTTTNNHLIKSSRNNTSLNSSPYSSTSSSSSSSCDYMAATGLSPKYPSTTASFSVNCLLNPTAAAVSTAAAFGSMLEESYRKQPQFSPYQVNKTAPKTP